jgi:hypothetical protein
MVGGDPRERWHDGRVRSWIALLLVMCIIGSPAAVRVATAATPPDQPVPPSTASPFLPERENVTDCLSSLPPPDCGSEERGGPGQWLAFGALLLGMAFIGWRIARGVRRRDREMSARG